MSGADGSVMFEGVPDFDVVSWVGASEKVSTETLVTGVAPDFVVVVACSKEGSFGRAPSVLERDVLDEVRALCDLAAAAASFA